MSRPMHVTALDEALMKALAELPAAEVRVAAVLDECIVERDAIEARIRAATDARMELITGIKHCAKAIEALGYRLPPDIASMKDVEALTWALSKDYDAARARLADRKARS